MPATSRADTSTPRASLDVRPPLQRRTREQWERVLDAGLALLDEAGYEGFTIPAMCARAGVPPRALYARVESKDALFLAVYEHGIARVVADHAIFRRPGVWEHLDDHERVSLAVRSVTKIFHAHRDFLRAIVLISGAHPEVARRGARYRADLAELFGSVLERVKLRSGHRSPAAASGFAFMLVFSALVVDTAYGVSFGGADEDELVRAIDRYLLD